MRGTAPVGVNEVSSPVDATRESLVKLTQRELLAAAKKLGVALTSKLKKDDLIRLVLDAVPDRDGGDDHRRTDGIAPRGDNGFASGSTAAHSKAQPGKSDAPAADPSAASARGEGRADGELEAGRDPEGPRLDAKAKGLAAPDTVVRGPAEDTNHAALSHKFEMGAPARNVAAAPQAAPPVSKEIPWGYERDRVTALVIDADRFYAYWEVVDSSIARARQQLGRGGEAAWLNLRIYDVTGRLFDGTNAHSTFDHRIERGDRQWFFSIGRPSSQLVVEIGMKSDEGFFAKIARSGRIEFPRRQAAAWSEPEWLTVRTTGLLERAGVHGPGRGARPGPGGGSNLTPAARAEPDFPAPAAPVRRAAWQDALRSGDTAEKFEEWREVHSDGGIESHRLFRWEGPATITSWEAGPFSHPVEIPDPVRESFVGKTRVFKSGPRTHVLYGPWQVVIRGIGAAQSRVVLSRWEVYRSWGQVTGAAAQGMEGESREGESGTAGTAGTRMMGASGQRSPGHSELRFGGASELLFLGASELLLRGASERMYAGASEMLLRGSSERLFAGASELGMRGASERLYAGASETMGRGASEGRLAAAGGASDQRLGIGPTRPAAMRDSSTTTAAHGAYPAAPSGRRQQDSDEPSSSGS